MAAVLCLTCLMVRHACRCAACLGEDPKGVVPGAHRSSHGRWVLAASCAGGGASAAGIRCSGEKSSRMRLCHSALQSLTAQHTQIAIQTPPLITPSSRAHHGARQPPHNCVLKPLHPHHSARPAVPRPAPPAAPPGPPGPPPQHPCAAAAPAAAAPCAAAPGTPGWEGPPA